MLRNLKNTPLVISNLRERVKLPAKFKGTIIEKWVNYWKNLVIDYRQMLQDVRTDIQDEPRKALMWTAGLTTVYMLYRNNPNEIDFKQNLKTIGNEVALVSDSCRNPKSMDHLSFIETCYNEGVIHYRSLGIASIMYTSDMSESCSLYKSQCSYLRPTLLSFPSRIVDVGIMGRWWNIYIKTSDYDENF